jgi:hypothetical protein
LFGFLPGEGLGFLAFAGLGFWSGMADPFGDMVDISSKADRRRGRQYPRGVFSLVSMDAFNVLVVMSWL